jgi:CDP-glycerol glycerophosphotransferase (TagB/SpsB family)
MLAGGLQTNEVLSRADAMITDYSGIYYDYLLLDRPVALTLDDFEQYKNEKGFCYDNPLELLCGYRVNTLDELLLFFDDVKNNVDRYYKDRISVKAKVNKYLDGQSSKRVVDFIIEKLKLQGE